MFEWGRSMDDAAAPLAGAHVSEFEIPSAEALSVLYLRVADTLERSAALAEDHAARLVRTGRKPLAELELERAERARQAATRGRAFASRLSADT